MPYHIFAVSLQRYINDGYAIMMEVEINNKQMEKIKKLLPEVLVVALFAVIAFVYFMPADLDGRILYRHDSQAGRGLGHEATEYYVDSIR